MNLQVFLLVVCLAGTTLSGRKGRRRKEQQQEERQFDSALERTSRGLVPQLLPNYTAPVLPNAEDVGCNHAFMACAYRDGCGRALEQYELTCSNLVNGLTDICSLPCQHALIALLSTPEGKRLMECRCGDDDCRRKKTRIEPCRAAVTWQSSPNTLVSCSTATWICLADPLCATALDYYNRNCKAMFKGRKCSAKCRNSLDILLRQDSALKLATCFCDGTEDFPCAAIREHTDTLCFGKKKEVPEEEIDNTIPGSSGGSATKRPLMLVVLSLIATYLIPETVASLRSLLTVSL